MVLAAGSFPDGDSSYSTSSDHDYSTPSKSASINKKTSINLLSAVSKNSQDCALKASETFQKIYGLDFSNNLDSETRTRIKNLLSNILSSKEEMFSSLEKTKAETDRLFESLLKEVNKVEIALLKAELQEQVRSNQSVVQKSLTEATREVEKIGSSMKFVKDVITSIQLLDDPSKILNEVKPQFESLLATSKASNDKLSSISLEAQEKIRSIKTLQ